MTFDENKLGKKLEEEVLKGAAAETVQRYGSAAKQHYVAYSGMDNETGQNWRRGLRKFPRVKSTPNIEVRISRRRLASPQR